LTMVVHIPSTTGKTELFIGHNNFHWLEKKPMSFMGGRRKLLPYPQKCRAPLPPSLSHSTQIRAAMTRTPAAAAPDPCPLVSALVAAPRPPPPRPPHHGLLFSHRSSVLRHPRHQARSDFDAPASDPPPPRRDSDAPAGARPPPHPDVVSRSSSAPERRPVGELYFSLLIATCLL
jgi:hypothetical protein